MALHQTMFLVSRIHTSLRARSKMALREKKTPTHLTIIKPVFSICLPFLKHGLFKLISNTDISNYWCELSFNKNINDISIFERHEKSPSKRHSKSLKYLILKTKVIQHVACVIVEYAEKLITVKRRTHWLQIAFIIKQLEKYHGYKRTLVTLKTIYVFIEPQPIVKPV